MGLGLSNFFNINNEPEPTVFKDPIFLIGLMRSGTTLLFNTLSEHPQLLRVGFELNKIWTEIGGAPCTNSCPERIEKDHNPKYANNITAYLTNYQKESQSFMRHLSRSLQSFRVGSGGVNYDWNDLYLMNKSPHLSNKIRYLNSLYPNAKFITIVRSPFGQAASLKMHFDAIYRSEGLIHTLPSENHSCWSITNKSNHLKEHEKYYPKNFELIAEAWLRLNSTIFQHLSYIDESRKITIAYEDLIENRKDALSSIFGFLKLKSTHAEREEKIIQKKRKVYNTKTKGKPLEKWKDHLSSVEKQSIYNLIDSNPKEYNYILSKVPKSQEYWHL